MRPLFRPDPKLPVTAMQTYEANAQTRPATCEQVECEARKNGWITVADVGTLQGQKIANYIRLKSGRDFTFVQDGNRVTFTFKPGQRCFAAHEIPVGAIYLKWGGDWRAVTSDKVRMQEADWVDDQANTLDDIRTAKERG